MNLEKSILKLQEVNDKRHELVKLSEQKDNEIEKIKWSYGDKIRELEHEMYKKMSDRENEFKASKEQLKSLNENLKDLSYEMDKYFGFIDYHVAGNIDTLDYTVYKYERGEKVLYNPIKELSSDIINVGLYITDNDKPKNCYDLVVCGVFPDIIKKSPWLSYGTKCHTDGTNIRYVIKSFSSKEEVMQYIENKNILEKIVTDVANLYAEYENVIEEFKNSKQVKIAYWNHKKYYYEYNYSDGIHTPMYKEVLENLKKVLDINI